MLTVSMRSRWIVVMLLLWLPFKGWAAVAMPFCSHTRNGEADAKHIAVHQQSADHLPNLGAESSTHDGSHHAAQGHSEHAKLSCNDCGACHLACAPAASSAALRLSLTISSPPPHCAPQLLTLFEPELRKPPPLVA